SSAASPRLRVTVSLLTRPAHPCGCFLLQAFQMVYEGAGCALRKFICLAAKDRLALFFDINRSLACESTDHAELLGRHKISHRLGKRIARELALRCSAFLLDHFRLALVKLAFDAELDSGALQSIMLSLLDSHLALGCACADTFACDTVNRDGCCDVNHVADLCDVADG